MKKVKLCVLLAMAAVLSVVLGITAFAEGNVCYIGEDETSRTEYATIDAAIEALGSEQTTIYVTENTTWAGKGFSGKNVKITSADQANPVTVTSSAGIRLSSGANVTFEKINIELEAGTNNYVGIVGNSTLKLNNATLTGAAAWGAVLLGDWGSPGILEVGAGSSVIGGTIADGAGGGTVVTIHDSQNGGGVLKLKGGKIINNNTSRANFPAVKVLNATTGKVEISGGATIEGTGAKNEIELLNANQLTVTDNFTGSIKVKYGALGEQFGAVNSGKTISGGQLTESATGAKAKIEDSKLYWDYAVYKGTTAADDVAANRYTSLSAAIRAMADKATATFTLVRDEDYTGYSDSNGIHHRNVTVNGNGKTLNLKAQLKLNAETSLRLEDITVNCGANQIKCVGDMMEVILGDGATVTGHTGDVMLSIENNGANYKRFIMEAGSKITNCTGTWGVVRANQASQITLNGEISGCTAPNGAVYAENASATVSLGPNARITGGNNFIKLNNANQLTLTDDFTGDVAVKFIDTNTTGACLGENFGNVAEGKGITTGKITHVDKKAVATVKDGKLYWGYSAYKNTDTRENRYWTVALAIQGVNDYNPPTTLNEGTVYITEDTEFKNYYEQTNGVRHRKVTIDGNGHTLKLGEDFRMDFGSIITLKNITVDLSTNVFKVGNATFTLGNGAKLTGLNSTGSPAVIVNPLNNGGTGGTFRMEEGSKIIGNTAASTGIVTVGVGATQATIYINGEISGNTTPYGGIYIQNTVGSFTLGPKAKVINNANASGVKRNIALYDANQLTLENSVFEGQVGVFASENATQAVKNTLGFESNPVGTATNTLAKAGSITSDVDDTLIAVVKDGKLIMVKKPTLAVTYDSGVYTEESATYGVVRALSTFSNVTEGTAIESCGTYFVKTIPSAGAVPEAENKKHVIENPTVSAGSGFMADCYEMPQDASVVAVSWYKLAGVNEYIYTIGAVKAVDTEKAVEYTEA